LGCRLVPLFSLLSFPLYPPYPLALRPANPFRLARPLADLAERALGSCFLLLRILPRTDLPSAAPLVQGSNAFSFSGCHSCGCGSFLVGRFVLKWQSEAPRHLLARLRSVTREAESATGTMLPKS